MCENKLGKNMRRTRFGRSRYGSGIRRSTFGRTRGFYSSGRSVPLRGPVAIVFSVGFSLFVLSFIFNFVYIFVSDDFNPLIFLIPVVIMMVMMITLMIVSFAEASKTIKSQGINPNLNVDANQSAGFFQRNVNILQLAQQAGLKVTFLPNQDPSTAQGLIQNDKETILVKNLSSSERYENAMVQNLSKGLVTYHAQEAWLIQQPPTFVENDLNFARFYNVKLLTQEQALASLQTLIPTTNKGQ
jgi:hypothetical protein